jgi:hypothetical protein
LIGGTSAYAREAAAGDDQPPRHKAFVDDLAPVVDVVDEVVQRTDPLGQAALDRAPFLRGDDARHEVERERAVAGGTVMVGARGVERDALLHEDRIAPAAGRGELLGPERVERAGVLARRPGRVDHLVVEAVPS